MSHMGATDFGGSIEWMVKNWHRAPDHFFHWIITRDSLNPVC